MILGRWYRLDVKHPFVYIMPLSNPDADDTFSIIFFENSSGHEDYHLIDELYTETFGKERSEKKAPALMSKNFKLNVPQTIRHQAMKFLFTRKYG